MLSSRKKKKFSSVPYSYFSPQKSEGVYSSNPQTSMCPTTISSFSLFSTIFYSNSSKNLTAHRIIYKFEEMDRDFSKKYLGSVLGRSNFYIKTSSAMYFCIRYVRSAQQDTKASWHFQINLPSGIQQQNKSWSQSRPPAISAKFLMAAQFQCRKFSEKHLGRYRPHAI